MDEAKCRSRLQLCADPAWDAILDDMDNWLGEEDRMLSQVAAADEALLALGRWQMAQEIKAWFHDLSVNAEDKLTNILNIREMAGEG